MNPKAQMLEMVLKALQRSGRADPSLSAANIVRSFADSTVEAMPQQTGRRAVNATYEAIPGRGTGHLEGLIDAPMSMKEAYTEAGSYINPETGGDVLYESLGMPQYKTRRGMGAYQPPAIGNVEPPFETNPLRIARPRVRMEEGMANPEDIAQLDLAEKVRGLMDVQNANPYHRTRDTVQGSGLRIPMRGPASESAMRDLSGLAKAKGFGGVSDTGMGLTMFPENTPPMQDLLRGGFASDIAEALGGDLSKLTGPVRATDPFDIGAYYTMYGDQPPVGSGTVTRRALEGVPADLLERLDTDELRRVLAALQSRDEGLAGQGFGAVREDVQNARRIARTGGMQALLRAAQTGGYVPAAVGMGGAYAGMRGQREAE